MNSIFKVFSIFNSKNQFYCVMIIGCMLIGSVLEAVGIGAILPLITIMSDSGFLDKHTRLKTYMTTFHIQTHVDFIIFCATILILLYVLKNIYMAWLSNLQISFSMKHQIYYAEKLLEGYLKKPYLYHLDQNSAILSRNVAGGAAVTFSNILVSIFTLITEIITAIVILIMLILVDAFTAVIIAGILGGMMYLIIKAFHKKITKQGELQGDYSAIYGKWINQALGAIKETKVLRKEAYFLYNFNKAYKEFGQVTVDFMFLNQLPKFFIEILVTTGLLFLIIIKLYMGVSPADIVPMLGILGVAAFRLMPCVNRIVNLKNEIKFQMPLFDIIYNELIEIKENYKKNDIITMVDENKIPFQREIVIENLSFQYPEGKDEVLQNVSFQIPKGTFVGIIGQSGAGKTTFVDILLGLLEPSQGKILVDDQNIFQNIRGWQTNLSYVPQTIYLIDGSIGENIALGVEEEEIDEEKIKKILRMSELYDFVEQLPDKLSTRVGERGVKLSGGQRQRIGIARALYCEPEVLILDEATSALDNETEKNITDTILKLKGQITIIAIAHRVSTLKNCDFKIEFKNGKAEILK